MADYYPLIARAIEGLSDKSPAVRRAVYERARNALLAQLQSLEPPVSPADITRESAALDLAIGAVEAIYVPSTSGSTTIQPPAEPVSVMADIQVPDEEPTEPMEQAVESVVENDAGQAYDNSVEESVDAAANEAATRTERPRIGSKRHSFGQDNRLKAIILVASVVAVVIAIAGLAIYNRVDPARDFKQVEEVADTPDTPSETGKFTERLGGTVAPSVAPTESGAPATVAVQQAVLFEEDADNPQQPKASEGRVQWRLDVRDAGPGLPLETVVRADVEFPQVGLSLSVMMRNNTDASLPASHTFRLTFSQKTDDPDHVVRDAGVILMKDDVTDRGMPLSGLPVPVKDNIFLIGLSSLPADVERNTQLLLRKGWVDVPVRFANGRRAILSFEKGASGDQVLNEAFRVW